MKNESKKISIICALYIGDRPVQVRNIKNDKLYYFKKQLEYFQKYQHLIHKFYMVVAFENEKIRHEYTDILKSHDNIIFYFKSENTGGSYDSWSVGLELDNGESDLVFLIEDDYIIYNENSIKNIVEDFNADPDLFFYCGWWSTTPLTHSMGITVNEHAAVSNGIINNTLYQESNLKFKIEKGSDRTIFFLNQMIYMEPFREANFKIKDIRKKYSCMFSNGVNNIQEYGIEGGDIIFYPLTKID